MLHDEIALPSGKSAGNGLDYFNNQGHADDMYVSDFMQDQIEPLR